MLENNINWKKTILKLLLGLVIIGVFIGLIFLILYRLGFHNMTKETIQELVGKTGVYGKLVFVVISFLQVTFVPIPASITIIAGNILFGFWTGFLLSYIGIMAGSMFAFFLGRVLGRRFVDWAFGDKEVVDYYLNKVKGKETVILTAMFFLPCFPDDALCALTGITNMKSITFLIIQIITRITSILGTLFFMSGEIIPYTPLGITIIVITGILAIVAFIIAMKNATRINDWFDNISTKVINGFKRHKKE